MRIVFILSLVCLFQSFALESFTQTTKISISTNDMKLESILLEIENQSKYRFAYDKSEIELNEIYSVDFRDSDIEEVLKKLFDKSDVTYTIINRQIVLSKLSRIVKQNHSISGKVTDSSGIPLPGVTVVVRGTTQGTITDTDGNYSLLNVPEDAILIFSFVGMSTQEIPIAGENTINVTMAEETIGLEEVVAIGYGTIKKKDLTGSVASVQGEVITDYPASTIAQTLQGRVAGVEITQNSGAPGQSLQIRIRGTNSILGDNSPLWIIDGFPGDPNSINLNDIQSIDVLKDASSTAIYGSRGANGVIIVTTKTGNLGTTKVDYEGSLSMQSLLKKIDLMDAKEYMLFYNIEQMNDAGKEYFTQDQINNAGKGTDWQDLMFRTAPIHDHTVTVSGGNLKTRFLVSSGYLNQQGIVLDNKGYERMTLRTNFEHDISKVFNIQINTNLTRLVNDKKISTGHWGTFALMYAAPPTHTPYNDDGTYMNFLSQYPFSYGSQTNMMMWVKEVSDIDRSNKIFSTLTLTIKPLEGLNLKLSGNVSNTDTRGDYYQTTKYIGSSGDAQVSISQSMSMNSNNIVTYEKTLNESHHFTFTGVVAYEQNIYRSSNSSATGFLSDNYKTDNLSAGSAFGTPSTNYSKWTLLSYLGRINYSYKNKYLLTASFRADGSSRYSEGNKWGYFPSGAVAWRISEEDFMDDISNVISNFKLRGSYGETGSTAINPYSTLSMLSTGQVVFDKDTYTTFAPSSTLPGDLKWETTAQTDVGIDLGFFNNRINFNVDYYIKNTRDLLNTVQMPRSSGYTSTMKNIGKIQNKGFEFLLDSYILEGDVKWNVTANVSLNRNKVIKLYGGQDIYGSYGYALGNDMVNIIREGEPLGAFYGYMYDGLGADGYPKYKNISGDAEGKINEEDKTIIGNPNPDFTYGLNSVLSFNNFDLTLYIQGSQGNDIFGESMVFLSYYSLGGGMNRPGEFFYDHWTPENTDAKHPKISAQTYNKQKLADNFIFNGSYIRLKNIQLAYNIPFGKLRINWIKSGQVYVSGQNLLTITNYPWIDPDVNTYGGSSSRNNGIDAFGYPSSKIFTFGVKIGF